MDDLPRHGRPWLKDMDDAACADAFRRFADFMCRPAFGAQSKREIELRLFALLYRARLQGTSVGQIADELAVSRTKARNLILDSRARYMGEEPPGSREARLRGEVKKWPRNRITEGDEKQLRFIVDDPFLRDILKNYAYERSIVLDGSFAGEVVTLSWPSYARLLASLIGDAQVREVLDALKAEVQRHLADNADEAKAFKASFDTLMKEEPTAREQLAKVTRLAEAVGVPGAKIANGLASA
jgi:hypothetical protein